MQSFARIVTIACIMLLPYLASAHGYWIEVEGPHKAKKEATIKMYYGEYAEGERTTGKPLDKMKDIKVYVRNAEGAQQEIAMKQLEGYWEGNFVPQSEGTYEITGINDVREVQDWTKHNLGITRPIQYLKAYYQVGKKEAQAKPAQYLDMS